MSSETPVTGHAYDGIEEYDNPLPGWWKWMFVGSFIFSVGYAAYFHVGAPGRSVADEYDRALAANTRLQFAEIGELEPNGRNVAKFLPKESWVKVGQVVFKTHCITCHGRNGEGKVGPNLTDEHYKNFDNLDGLVRVINKGAAGNAMPAWENRLLGNEIVLVSAYVASLKGTNAPGGKDPEGRVVAEWPEVAELSAEPTENNTDETETDSSADAAEENQGE